METRTGRESSWGEEISGEGEALLCCKIYCLGAADIVLQILDSASGYTLKRFKGRNLRVCLYISVDSSITHSNQKVETTHVSIDG